MQGYLSSIKYIFDAGTGTCTAGSGGERAKIWNCGIKEALCEVLGTDRVGDALLRMHVGGRGEIIAALGVRAQISHQIS